MSYLTRALILAAIVGAVSILAPAQSSSPKAATGSITGRITNGDNAAVGVAVVLYPAEERARVKPTARAVADQDGRFMLTNIPAGRYQLTPVAADMVVSDNNDSWRPGKPVNLAAGEMAEGFDFQITRGGVVTGRVTDHEDKPIIGERINLEPVDKNNGPQRSNFNYSRQLMDTDDRGIYRVYGLPAGRYRVSAGEDPKGDGLRFGGRRGFYPKVYYPNVNEAAEAKIVEVLEGGETTDINITLGPLAQSYTLSGRVVNEGGEPVPGLLLGYGKVHEGGGLGGGGYGMGMPTNARGEFKIDNVLPGRYAAFVVTRDAGDVYSDSVSFEISDKDVSGIEVKVHPGATISGHVIIESTTDRNLISRLLQQISLYANTETPGQVSAPNWSETRVSADGSFRVAGLKPGKARVTMGGWPPPKGLTQTRIERGGVEQKDGIEVGAGEQVSGVRLVVAYGTAVLRGQVNVVNGTLPENVRLIIHARRQGSDTSQFRRPVEVDVRGRFTIEGLAAGEYELALGSWARGPGGELRIPEVRQSVTVSDSGEANVTMVVDLAPPKREDAP
ncbi:MAG: carboxypeptidase-like regulatory domain-containing protein [Acidobacteriota bacterium]|nr:carboxypeptidase-like regulatory domain-containing protein [Acidobacteriota bacterium]